MSRDADKDLDAFIERRAREATRTGKDQALEEMWAASERRERERRQRENAAAWYAFHAHMQEVHARLSEEHEARALGLLEDERDGGSGIRPAQKRYTGGPIKAGQSPSLGGSAKTIPKPLREGGTTT